MFSALVPPVTPAWDTPIEANTPTDYPTIVSNPASPRDPPLGGGVPTPPAEIVPTTVDDCPTSATAWISD